MLSCLVGVLLSQGFTGSFSQMDGGIGHRLDFERNGRVVYQGLGDLAKVRLSGSFSTTDGRLTVEIPKLSEKTFMPTQFQLVKWGPASYLLAEDEVPHFLYRLRKGWRGDGSVFLRDAALPSGQPDLPPFQRRHRSKPVTVIHCAYEDDGPLSGGTKDGNLPGTVLRQIDGNAIAWIEDADADFSYIRRLAGSALRPGLKMEPSESPLRWRAEIRRHKRAFIDEGLGIKPPQLPQCIDRTHSDQMFGLYTGGVVEAYKIIGPGSGFPGFVEEASGLSL